MSVCDWMLLGPRPHGRDEAHCVPCWLQGRVLQLVFLQVRVLIAQPTSHGQLLKVARTAPDDNLAPAVPLILMLVIVLPSFLRAEPENTALKCQRPTCMSTRTVAYKPCLGMQRQPPTPGETVRSSRKVGLRSNLGWGPRHWGLFGG